MNFPTKVKVVEVGPRDGLQNEPKIVPTQIKIEFINRLAQTGLKYIEVTSFVSPKWVPQMADNVQVMKNIIRPPGIHYSALVPNLKGFKMALNTGINEVAVFTAASETFTKKNINCTIAESLKRFSGVITAAEQNKIPVRGYISCSLGCPYEGEVRPEKVAQIADELVQMGCYEVSLGDTIGIGTPGKAQKLISNVAKKIPLKKIGVHFHDTYGQALANIFAALQMGVATFDSSIAGLGGCPYAVGATGNIATEDVVYMFNGLHIETGIDLSLLVAAGKFISDYLERDTRSKVGTAIVAQEKCHPTT